MAVSIPVPENAVGRVGMVAALKRVGEKDLGKLVVLREPAGFVTSLVGSERPVFAWLVRALGEPLEIRGKLTRDIYVADRCLVPMGEVSDTDVRAIMQAHADKDFDAALDDLRKIMGVHEYSAEELEVFVEKAGEQFAIERALEKVPVPVALREIGFTDVGDGDCLRWTGIHDGIELHVEAGPSWIVNWTILATANAPRHAVCMERVLPNEDMRGQVVKTILDMWRAAFGNSVVPDCLQLGVTFERHRAEMRSLNLGLPTLRVDPVVFRATLKWLRTRHLDLVDQDKDLGLAFSDGLLRLTIGDVTYGCPAWGNWVDECSVRFPEFLSMPPEVARRQTLWIERAAGHVLINGYPVSVKQSL